MSVFTRTAGFVYMDRGMLLLLPLLAVGLQVWGEIPISEGIAVPRLEGEMLVTCK